MVRDEPILSPDMDYDGKGVFTGCFIDGKDDCLTYAYTSVGALPIHHTLPHPRGSESLSLAKSFDSGKTWQKLAANPILPCEPEGLDVTGWRDPYVSRWPAMAKLLEVEDATLFGIISGGIRDVTPTTFVYSINVEDLTRWTYLGPLVNFGLNFSPSRWSGDLGRNWEVTNFLSLQDEIDPSVTRDFLVMGTEGCLEDKSTSDAQALSRPVRGQLWMSGNLHREDSASDSAPRMSYSFGGHLDHGCLYAANSFFDPNIRKPVVWGWIPEDDLCDDLRHAQGWSGLLSMPRELRMQTLQHVIGASSSRLQDITSIEVEDDGQGSSTVRTLGIEPLQRLVHSLRQGKDVSYTRLEKSTIGLCDGAFRPVLDAPRTDRWELWCSLRIANGCQRVGLRILHSPDSEASTTLSFDPSQETLTIERPPFPGMSEADSSNLINSKPETAPHTLFTTRDPRSGVEQTEVLEISAWRDNSVLEVFVNGRTAISTRLYAADETFGVQFFAEGGEAELVSAEVWDNLANAAA